MLKIRFFFLQILFFCVPLIYAWLYLPGTEYTIADMVAQVFPSLHWSGFESVKVIFVLFVSIIVILTTLGDWFAKNRQIRRVFLVSLLVFVIWSVTSYTLNRHINPYFLIGNPEKTHGWFFYAILFCLFWILRSLTQIEKKQLFLMSILGFMWVALYALFQKLGLDPLRHSYNTRLDLWRVFSTLGNPNYLAGYVLVLLPLLRVYRFPNELNWQEHLWEISIWFISGVLIYWTGSYLAWILFAGYVGFVIVQHVLPKKWHRTAFWISALIIFVVLWTYLGQHYGHDILASQKMKWFIARWYLWETGISALTHDAWHFLFGFGPDGFLSVSEKFRHSLLSVYEDPVYRIDRSHNVFIDFALHFGVPMLCILLWFVGKMLPSLSQDKKVALLIFALYFSFNIPVLVHFLIVMQIFTSVKYKN